MSEMIQAFGQGWMVGEAITQSREKRKALNAAVEQYGDVARDPGLFSALRNYDIAGTSEARAQKGFDQAYDITAKNESRVDTQFQNSQQDRQKQAVLGLVNGLRTARDRGEDIGTAFDKLADTLPSLGVNPDDIPAMRQAVIDNPAILDDYYASLTTGAPGRAGAAGAPSAAQLAKEKTQDEASQQVSQLTEEMRAAYQSLDAGGGIPSEKAPAFDSVVRWMRSSGVGRVAGSMLGTQNESLRQQAEGARQLLMLAIKNATGMSAQQMNSNMELQAMLKAATDPGATVESNMAALDRIEQAYGASTEGAQPAAPPPDAPKGPTQIYPGYVNPKTGAKFKGGDWKDPANWEMPE